MHDDYKQLDHDPDKIERCPVCGSQAKLWQYSTSPTAPRQLVVMCEHGDPIGPQDGIKNEGCLLYMPPDGFYQERIASAVRYWNDFAKALTAMRTSGVPVAGKVVTVRQRGASTTEDIIDADGVKTVDGGKQK